MGRKYTKLLVSHERELREQGERFRDDQRKEDFAELQRRLHVLNDAHAATKEAQLATVPRETFVAWQDNVNDKLNELTLSVQRLIDKQADLEKAVTRKMAWATLALGVLGAVWAALTYFWG